eukprot:UN02470
MVYKEERQPQDLKMMTIHLAYLILSMVIILNTLIKYGKWAACTAVSCLAGWVIKRIINYVYKCLCGDSDSVRPNIINNFYFQPQI